MKLNGEFYVIGGSGGAVREIAKIEKCQLKTLNYQLPFDFETGSCSAYPTGTKWETGLLCFGDNKARICHTFDGTTVKSLDILTNYCHRNVRLANYRGQPFTVGSNNPDHAHTEIMDGFNSTSAVWKSVSDYHFLNRLYTYAVLSTEQSVIVFGGCCEDIDYLPYMSKTVASFNDNVWTKLGELKSGRYGHSVTALENSVLVLGGLIEDQAKVNSPAPTEKWIMDAKNLTYSSIEINPKLQNYFFWPLLFPVDYNFCQ